MEYLRLVNLTEICPSRRVGHFKAPCFLLGACPVTVGQRTDINTPERVQPIRQGCPLTLGIKPL